MGKTRVVCLGVGSLTAILLLAASTFAQQTASSWNAIDQAKRKNVIVVRDDNRSQSGRLEQISPDSLTISDHENNLVITRDEVRQVFVKTSRSRKRGALWGLLLGGGGGAVAGAVIVQPCSSSFCIVNIGRGEGAAAGAAAGAAVGSLVGALVGGRHNKVLLYDRAVPLSRLQDHY